MTTTSDKELRVCMLVDRFPPLIGGAEIQAYQLSIALAQHGIKVSVLTRRVVSSLPSEDHMQGVQVHRLPPSGHRTHSVALRSVVTFLWALWRQRFTYDVLHVHEMFGLMLAAILIRIICKKPLVIKIPGRGQVERNMYEGKKSTLYSCLLHQVILPKHVWLWLLSRVDVFIVLNDAIEEELRRAKLGHKVVRMTNAVDARFCPVSTEQKTELRRQLGLPPDAQIIVSHGRIVRIKQVENIIKAVAQLLPEYPQLRLLLVGSFFPEGNSYEQEIKCLIKTLRLAEHVTLTGETQNPEYYLQAADVYVLASETEGQPNALMEAMGCGLPCIATDISGVKDLIRDGENGLLFPVAKPDALVERLRWVFANSLEAEAMGKRAHQIIELRYRWQVLIPLYESLYHRLLASNVRRAHPPRA